MIDDTSRNNEPTSESSSVTPSDPEPLPPLAEPPEGSWRPPALIGQAPAAATPLLPPLLRVLVYLPSCLLALMAGGVVTAIIATLWIIARRGSLVLGDDPTKLFERETDILMMSSTLGIYPVVFGVTCLFVVLVDRRPLAHIGLRRQHWGRDCLVGAGIGVAFVAVSLAVPLACGWIGLTPIRPPWEMWVLATLIVYPLIGLTEEIVFRGYLLTTFDEWRGRAMAIGVTSVLFWMMHLPDGKAHQPFAVVDYVAIGVMLALCRYSTDSLWLPMGLHAAFDWALVSAVEVPHMGMPAFFRIEIKAPHWLVGAPGEAGLVDMILGLLLVAVVYRFLYLPTQRPMTAAPTPAD